VAALYAAAASGGVRLLGSGMDRGIELRTAKYKIAVSIITPYMQLAGDGKEPVLPPLGHALEEALKKACNAAYRLLDKTDNPSIKEAAWEVMEEAYMAASGDGELPANARQIMYAARPLILERIGRTQFGDKYFRQGLLPDFMEENPELTADWDVVFDARGHFVEPHTRREIGLGTIDVRTYLGDRVDPGAAVGLSYEEMYPTLGPLHRYSAILFIEKEGFTPLLEAARIAE